jgi:hypothetical protein
MKDLIQPTVSMSEPPAIPEAYHDTILNFLRQYWSGRKWEMQESFGFYQLPILTDDQLLTRPLADTLAQIARAAAGQIQDPDDLLRGEIYEGIQGLMQDLFAPPGLGLAYHDRGPTAAPGGHIPASFWESNLGQMVARALIWLKGDKLITLAEAAAMRGVSIPAMSQAVRDGRLTRYVDPNARRRQGRTLVSRAEVKGMDQ